MKLYKVIFKEKKEPPIFSTLWQTLPNEVWDTKRWNYKGFYDTYTLSIFCSDFVKFQKKHEAIFKEMGTIQRYNEVKITSDTIYNNLQSVISTIISLSNGDVRWAQKQAQSYIKKAFKMLKEIK